MMLRQFGLPTAVAMYFTSHVARRFAGLRGQHDADQPLPFLGIDDLIHLAQDLEAEGQAVAGGAILSCLDAIKQAQIFATQPSEGTSFQDELCRDSPRWSPGDRPLQAPSMGPNQRRFIPCRQPERVLLGRKGDGRRTACRACSSTRPSCS